jgi:biotin carboxyl carrier protein
MTPDFDIKIGKDLIKIKILKEESNILTLMVDDKVYDVDIEQVEQDIYSLIHKNKSYNIEIIEGANSKNFTVNTLYQSFDVEIFDAEARYIASRNLLKELEGKDTISSPMPGRIVRIPVAEGQEIVAGQTLIVVSAMKMESEYKASRNGIVKQIHVKEGEIVSGHQPLVTLE